MRPLNETRTVGSNQNLEDFYRRGGMPSTPKHLFTRTRTCRVAPIHSHTYTVHCAPHKSTRGGVAWKKGKAKTCRVRPPTSAARVGVCDCWRKLARLAAIRTSKTHRGKVLENNPLTRMETCSVAPATSAARVGECDSWRKFARKVSSSPSCLNLWRVSATWLPRS